MSLNMSMSVDSISCCKVNGATALLTNLRNHLTIRSLGILT